MDIISQIDLTRTPKHIAIIMDGNGRWAKKQGQERLFGHSIGVDSVRETLRAAKKIGVKYVTFYAFSTENWGRPQDEVEGLMNLMVKTIANEVPEMNANGAKLWSIGDVSGLPEDCQEELRIAKEATAGNNIINMVLALNYSSRWEISEAVRKVAQKVERGELSSADITEDIISMEMETAGMPDPELLIRTSGEQRLSNFLLWQTAYTEFYFTNVLWPDFREEDLYKAVLDFQTRERRFGQVSEQLI